MLPEDGTLLQKHFRDKYLICIYDHYCAFGWCNNQSTLIPAFRRSEI